MYDLRRMLRLFRTFSMIPKLQKLFHSYQESDNKYAVLSKMISHFAYAVFYFIDNLAILCRIKFLLLADRNIEKFGYSIWFFGLLTSLIENIFKIRYSFRDEAELKNAILNNMTPQAFFNELNKFTRERKNCFLNVVRNVCDLMVAMNKIDLPRKVLRTNLNPILVAICGTIATVVSIYQMCEKELKPKIEKREKERKESEIFDRRRILDEISPEERLGFKKILSVSTGLHKQEF